MTDLFSPLTAGDIELKNRIIMAPLTRGRAGDSRIANAMMAEYYAQRATAGLIITEATAISPMGYGWKNAPAMYTDAQAAGWRLTTDAVHQAGGKIVLQLWHMGRVSHPDFLNGELPVAPSVIAAEGQNRSIEKDYVVPHALTVAEIKATAQDYARGAKMAIQSGFDGVEIHGANGYLIDQFLKQSSNQRTDEYGGTIPNRARFLLEVVDAVAAEIGAGRTGLRVSAVNGYNSMQDDDLTGLFTHVAEQLNARKLAFLEIKEPASAAVVSAAVRKLYKGTFIVNQEYEFDAANDMVKSGHADAVAFGSKFISNPDLVERFRAHAPLNELNMPTLYAGGPEGYVDYPFMAERAA
jgi:N-ethylmaleimide reductase